MAVFRKSGMVWGVALLFVLVLAVGVSTGVAAPKARVAVVFATGGLGDKSFNDSGFAGLKRAEKELGIESQYAEPQQIAEYETLLTQFAQTRKYDLIVSIGFDQADALKVVSAKFPNQKFAIIDTVVDAPNVASYVYKEQERGFVLGVIAGLMTTKTGDPRINPEKVIGVVGGMDIPLINANIAGYMAGAKYVNPDVEVLYSYVGAWADPAKGKELTLVQFNQGADIVWQAAGRSGLGVIKAAEETNHYAIGADSDQCYLAPKNVLTNGMKFVDNTIYTAIEQVISGKFKGGIHVLGLAEKGLGYTTSLVPADIVAKVDALAQKVISGELAIPDKIQDVEAWLKAHKK
ncbi:MAG: BMP family ABC transporter substrate-binding protein [Firmicutes bacterium]|nr:BMP family ABC transporter substrate-binding protein [Bacillota bacterium]